MKPYALIAALLCLVLPATAEAQGGHKPAKAEAPSDDFVHMPEISAPIVDAGRLDGILRVRVVLQPRTSSAAARLANRMPDLNATALSTAIEFARLYASPYVAVDVERLSASLATSLKRMDPGIAKVLIVKVSAKTV